MMHPFEPEYPVFFKRTGQLHPWFQGAIPEINMSFLQSLKLQSQRELPIRSTDSQSVAAINGKRQGLPGVSDDKPGFKLFNS